MATVNWNNASGGNWETASDWSTGSVPGSGDDVFISASGAYTVSVTTPTTQINSITISDLSAALVLSNGASLSTVGDVTVDRGGSARLKIDAYGGSGGSKVTVGGNLTNASTGNGGDGGVSVGNASMTASDTLMVNGSFINTGGALLTIEGGQTGASANVIVTGSVRATLTGQYSVVANAGGASLQWGGGKITHIGDGAPTGRGSLLIVGSTAYAEDGASNSNSALTNLATIASNGALDLRDGAVVTTSNALIVARGGAQLALDEYGSGGTGGSKVTIGGNLTDASFGVSVGNSSMTASDTLTVNGSFINTGDLVLEGGRIGASANMVVTRAVQATLTGQYDVVANAGGASLQWGRGKITQIGDGASNFGYLRIDGRKAYAEDGVSNSNSALTNLATIASNGELLLQDGAVVTTSNALTVEGADFDEATLSVDAVGRGGSKVTIGGNLTNAATDLNLGGVVVGNSSMTASDTLTVNGSFINTGLVILTGDTKNAAGTTNLIENGAVSNSSIIDIGGNSVLRVSAANAYTQTAGETNITGSLDGAVNNTGGLVSLQGGSIHATSFTNAGTVQGFGTVAGPVTNTKLIDASGGTLSFLGGIANSGTILASGGTLFADSALSGTGKFELEQNGVANFGTTVPTSQTVQFLFPTGTIDLQDPVDFHALVNGMVAGDLIDLINTTETGYSYNSGTLTVNSSGGVLHLRIAGNFTTSSFTLASDGHSGTNITVS
jgi:hypothetical protein